MNFARAIVCVLAVISWQTSSAEVIQYHPNFPAYIGGNYDPSYPGRAYPECLERTTVRAESLLPDQKPGTPAATQFFIRKVTSRQELYRLLNVSLSMSGSYGLFSGDFSGSLEQENTFSEESFTWIIQGYSNFGKFVLDSVKLRPEARALANNPAGFRNRCGTDFVGIEVRAVQAAAVFTIKNLSQSDRRVLEASFNASYGSVGAGIDLGAKYSEFIKSASAYGQIEVNVYAIGGPGVNALAPIITSVDKPDIILKTLQDYFAALTLDRSAAVAYNTGSLQSLINRDSIESEVYNKFIADAFIFYEDLGAEHARLRKIYGAKEDYALTQTEANAMATHISNIADKRVSTLNLALNCKHAFNDVSVSTLKRRTICSDSQRALSPPQRKFAHISPKPYYLRYFVANDLIPGEEVINFNVRGPTLKSVQLVKGLNLASKAHTAINSVQINPTQDGAFQAGTSLSMANISDTELPVGVRIETNSGNVYFEAFVFTRAPAASPSVLLSTPLNLKNQGLEGVFRAPEVGRTGPFATPEEFKRANESGNLLPNSWKERP